MTGDERHMTFISDSRLTASPKSSGTTGATGNRQQSTERNMREKDDRSLHGSLLRELSIGSLGGSTCWYNLPDTDACSIDTLEHEKRVNSRVISFVTPVTELSPKGGVEYDSGQHTRNGVTQRIDIQDAESQSCCNSDSKTSLKSKDFSEKHFSTSSTKDINHIDGVRNVTTQSSIFSISSSRPSHSQVDDPGASESRAETGLFRNLRVRGKEPKSLGRFLQFHGKDSANEIKGVKFQSFSDTHSDNVSKSAHSDNVSKSAHSDNAPRSMYGSLKDINQSSRQPILGQISPSDLGTGSEKSDYKGSQVITHRLEAVNRNDAQRAHKTSSTTGASKGTEEDGATGSDVAVRTGHCRCADLSTQRGRRNHALMIMLVSVIPVIVILIQNSIGVYSHSSDLKQHNVVKGEILFSSVEIGNVLHRTQIERGTTALYVSSKGDQIVLKNLTAAYLETDKAISSLTRWVVDPNITYFQSADEYHARIKDFRSQVLSSSVPNVTIPQVIKFYSDDNAVIVRWVGQFIQHSKSGDLWKTLVGYYMLILSKEQAGVERALGSTYYAKGGYNDQEMLDYLERKILGMTYLERCTEYSATVYSLLKNVFYGKETDVNLQRMRSEILHNALNGSDVAMGAKWFNNMTKYINILKAAQDSIANDVILGLQQEVDGLTDALVVSISVMVVAVILFPLVILAVYRLTNRIQAYAQTLQERTRDLDVERKRSENLLYELLPVSVAQKLLNHQDVPPVSYPAVTIFFSDIVGFTNICSRSTPFQVIDMLNSLYRMFDDIIDSYDVYKVETIGDAYMVASGLPHENIEGHAVEMADMALDLRDQLCQKTVQHLPGESLRMRIGLNSGPVVAGVVGHKMPRYCLFGDTVNVASRMESTSLPLKIQITDRCRTELESKGEYIITERGKVEIKGKGLMTTYWLVGKQHHDLPGQQHVGRT